MSKDKKEDTALPPEVTDLYEVAEVLGTGHFSKVKLAIDRKTGAKVAIKIIKKPSGSKISMLKTEVDILTKAEHPNIVKCHKVIDTPDILYLVLELLTGGELFDRIIARGHYSEADARTLTITMLKAVSYLHSMGIAHRDLKPENILLKDTSEDAEIKITDFGLSKIFADDMAGEVVMKTACGTPGYVAPEVLQHEAYNSQVDLWSIGVIVYILLCGFPPFYGDNDNQMFKKIKAGQYKFLAPYWDPISKEAKDFVSKLLVVDWKKRMDCEQALKHPWIAPAMSTSVSTRNLFQSEKADEPQPSEDAADPETLQSRLRDHQNGPHKLHKTFDLPQETQVVGDGFKCKQDASCGILHVTTTHLCFLSKSKKIQIKNSDVSEIKKSKRSKLPLIKGRSIVVTSNGSELWFDEFKSREDAYRVIGEQCKNAKQS